MPKLKFQFTVNWAREEEERYIAYIRQKIKEAREDNGMTQSELAAKLGRTQTYLSKIEKGDLVPSVVELLGVAQFTEKPIQYFLPIQDAKEDQLNGKEWQLVTDFRSIEDDAYRDIAIGQVRQLAERSRPKGKK